MLIIVTVSHLIVPYYVQSEEPEKEVYIRLGSTSQRAGPELTTQIQCLTHNTFFDELP